MSQLATIFEKIKEDFYTGLPVNETQEQFDLVFAPFSTGFTSDDFLFLDTNNASSNVHKYLDELYEFSQIANTIPKLDNYWVTSNDQNDFLFNKYKSIIQSLRLIDIDTLQIEMLYEHPIFEKALQVVSFQEKDEYSSFYAMQKKLLEEINQLKASENSATIAFEINLKENNLEEVKREWVTRGYKDKIEQKIVAIIKDEIKRFISKLSDLKASFETAIRTHPGSGSNFYLTYCSPNNLYNADKLDWKKITINKTEITRLLQKESMKNYQTIFGDQPSDLDLDEIEFELLLVNVTRPWFESSLLESPFWDINIINKEEIEIPSITSKLIFIRKIDLKINTSSQTNTAFLNSNQLKNFGPFVLNPTLLKSDKKIQLLSVNTALNLERKTVFNVASQINTKKQFSIASTPAKNIISQKQQQFIKLAPRLQQKQQKAVKISTPLKLQTGTFKAFNLKNMISAIQQLNVIKYEFSFIDAVTKETIPILPECVTLYKDSKKINIVFNKQNSTILYTQLQPNTSYKLSINKEGYEIKEVVFKTEIKNTPVKLTINLVKTPVKEPEFIDNSFQLIGVIASKISPYPNPIKMADYL